MTDSNDKTKVIKTLQREIDDTACKSHRGRTARVESHVTWLSGIMVLMVAGFIGWVVTSTSDSRAHGVRIEALNERVGEFKKLAIAMHQSTVEIARSVGKIEGMLAVTMKGD